MERLTKNYSGDYCTEDVNEWEITCKLGHLEDLEEELGISLEVLFKALREGIWIREYPEDEPSFHRVAISCFKGRWFISTDFERIMNVKCFKSAWGFTKEELE